MFSLFNRVNKASSPKQDAPPFSEIATVGSAKGNSNLNANKVVKNEIIRKDPKETKVWWEDCFRLINCLRETGNRRTVTIRRLRRKPTICFSVSKVTMRVPGTRRRTAKTVKIGEVQSAITAFEIVFSVPAQMNEFNQKRFFPFLNLAHIAHLVLNIASLHPAEFGRFKIYFDHYFFSPSLDWIQSDSFPNLLLSYETAQELRNELSASIKSTRTLDKFLVDAFLEGCYRLNLPQLINLHNEDRKIAEILFRAFMKIEGLPIVNFFCMMKPKTNAINLFQSLPNFTALLVSLGTVEMCDMLLQIFPFYRSMNVLKSFRAETLVFEDESRMNRIITSPSFALLMRNDQQLTKLFLKPQTLAANKLRTLQNELTVFSFAEGINSLPTIAEFLETNCKDEDE